MSRKYVNRQRFVVMPRHGISGPAMQAAIFRPGNTDALSDTLSKQLDRFSSFAKSTVALTLPTAEAELASVIDPKDFEIIDDGAATVAMSQAVLQMLVGRARVLGLPQMSQEGHGLPV